jgi:membrane protein
MPTISCAVEVDRPLPLVYQRWTASPLLPSFMGGTAAERQVDAVSVDWVLLVEGKSSNFDAVVIEHIPEQGIAWENGVRPHSGVVRFEDLDGGRSRISVEIDWGTADEAAVADQLIVRRQLQRDLERFRHDAESTAPPPSGSHGATSLNRGSASGAPAGADGAAGAAGDDRGRSAESPTEIPAGGWVDIAKRTGAQVKQDNLSIVAAGVAFYVFLALVPALIAVISVYGLVADPVDVQRQLDSALSAVPTEAADLVRTQVTAITEQGRTSIGLALAVSVVVALLGASKGMQALVTALNIAYDEDETRRFFRLKGLVLLLTLGMAVAAVLGVGAMVVIGNVAARLGTAGELALTVLRWPLLAVVIILGLAVLYRYAPDRDAPSWRWVTPGAVVATVLWLVGSIAFSIYVGNFGSYNETYGSLGAVVVLLLWLLLTAYAIVLGAELDGEAERQTVKDSTSGPAQPLGQRRAYAADTVASNA